MTSLVRRIVATFVEPVERSRHPTTAAPGPPDPHDGAADEPPPRPAVVFTPPRSPRGDGSSPARVVAPPHPAGAPGAPPVASPTTSPSRTRPSPATARRPADATRPSGDRRRDRARGRRRGGPGRGCLRGRVTRPRAHRRGTPLRLAPDRRAGGRARAVGRRSPAVAPPRARRRRRRAVWPFASRLTGSTRPRAVGSPGSGSSRSRRRPQPRPAAASRSRERRS